MAEEKAESMQRQGWEIEVGHTQIRQRSEAYNSRKRHDEALAPNPWRASQPESRIAA